MISTIFIPYNLHVYLNINFADSIGSIFLSCAFLLCVSKKKRYLSLAILISLLYLTKSNYFFFSIFLALYFLFFSKESKRFFLPLFLIIMIFTWGIFGLKKSNMFPFFSSISSHGQFQFNVVLNENFHKIYPNFAVDTIDLPKLPKTIKTEKDQYYYYKKLGKKYLNNKENLQRYLLDRIIVLKFIFFGIYEDQKFIIEKNKIRYSSIVNKFFLNLSVILSCYLMI